MEKGVFISDFFLSEDYSVDNAIKTLLQPLKNEDADYDVQISAMRDGTHELGIFLRKKADQFETVCQSGLFFEEFEKKLNELVSTAQGMMDICSQVIGVQNTGNSDSSQVFRTLNQLLVKRAQIVTERSRNESEQMWSMLDSRAEQYLDSGDMASITSMLSSASEQLGLISNSPMAEEKAALLRRTQENVWSVVKDIPFDSKIKLNMQQVAMFYDLYNILGKVNEFLAKILNRLSMSLCDLWKFNNENNMDGVNSVLDTQRASIASQSTLQDTCSTTFKDKDSPGARVERFFSGAINEIVNEVNSSPLPQIWNDERAWDMVLGIFINLVPSFERRFSVFTCSTQQQTTEDIAKFYTTTQEFSSRLEHVIFQNLNSVEKFKEYINREAFKSYSNTLFAPFITYQISYTSHEEPFLQQVPVDLNIEKTFIGDKFQISRFIEQMFKAINESMDRCISFSHGLSVPQFTFYLDGYIEDIFDKLLTNSNSIITPNEESPKNSIFQNNQTQVTRLSFSREGQADIKMRTRLSRTVCNIKCFKQLSLNLNNLANKISKCKVFEYLKTNFDPRSLETLPSNPIIERWESIACNIVLWDNLSLFTHTAELASLIDKATINQGLSAEQSYATLAQKYSACSSLCQGMFKKTSDKLLSSVTSTQEEIIRALVYPLEDLLEEMCMEATKAEPGESQDSELRTLPSRCATRIGEHLMTLPYYIGSHFTEDELWFSLNTLKIDPESVDVILAHSMSTSKDDACFKIWSRLVAIHTIEHLREAMCRLTHPFTIAGKRQLKVNVEYLDCVVDSLCVELKDQFTQVYHNPFSR